MSNGESLIQHVFVLMLENRAFDHMLGFSRISGTDAATGDTAAINGLTGTEANEYNGTTYTVSPGADYVMPVDPHHEFGDILEQLCGAGATYPAAGAYPPITRSGFVASYVASGGNVPGEVMKCFTPQQLPVLNALAEEFVVCDNWHASLPGPTWPNRMFVHAASSGGLDHSPSTAEIADWEAVDGFQFPNGSIFDALNAKQVTRRLYAGDDFPMVAALKGIGLDDIRHYSSFASDLQGSSYDFSYVFIEPSYDVLNDYRNSTSQHPLTDVTLGEGLIKDTYEAIRNSQYWDSSLLVITWDENGGFYDHAIPPAAPAPGDTTPDSPHNQNHFTFEQYGPRVPAIVVSSLIPKNLIDHRLYDHASIPATLESLFGLAALTTRDRRANRLDALISLSAPRNDTPATLPPPAAVAAAANPAVAAPADLGTTMASRPDSSVNEGTLPGVIHSALRQDLQMSPPSEKGAIIARVRTIKTREQARQYLAEVQRKVKPRRERAAGAQVP